MEKKNIRVTILGAGISGLASAHWLNKAGYEVKILESNLIASARALFCP